MAEFDTTEIGVIPTQPAALFRPKENTSADLSTAQIFFKSTTPVNKPENDGTTEMDLELAVFIDNVEYSVRRRLIMNTTEIAKEAIKNSVEATQVKLTTPTTTSQDFTNKQLRSLAGVDLGEW